MVPQQQHQQHQHLQLHQPPQPPSSATTTPQAPAGNINHYPQNHRPPASHQHNNHHQQHQNHHHHNHHHHNHHHVHHHHHHVSSSKHPQPTSTALRTLMLEFKSLQEEPVEGFRVKIANEDNLFEWEVALFGPPRTLYEGGYFKAAMKFPPDYPYSPPSVKFLTKVWHPNVYENGDLCISILHPPIDDPQSGELPCERWNPTQNVRTVLLSVISLLNEPNTYSPANVDASVMYRKWKESNGKDTEYENIIRRQVAASRTEAERDNVVVPTTLEEYCIRHKTRSSELDDLDVFYEDDLGYDIDNDDDFEEDDDDDVEEIEEDNNGNNRKGI